jgi:hypothetical protein
VKSIFVNYDNIALVGNESLNLGSIKLSVNNVIKLCKKKYELGSSDVELASSVILKAIELGVGSPAHSDLDGHSAVSTIGEILVKVGASLKAVDTGLVSNAFCGKLDLLHCIEKRCYIVSGNDMSVSFELVAVN